MKIRQVSVFLENRKGRLYEVCSLLGENNISIRALNVAESDDFGILRMVLDKPEDAEGLLREHNFTANFTDIVAVEVEDRPGGLAEILRVLSENDVNVEYMYGFVEKNEDKALLVFRFEKPDEAIACLAENKIRIVGRQDIIGL